MHGGLGWIISAMIIVSGRFGPAPDFRAKLHKPAATGKPVSTTCVYTWGAPTIDSTCWWEWIMNERRLNIFVLLFPFLWEWLFQPFPSPHQIFKESRDLSGEHSQVEEACGHLIVVLGQVAVPQVLQNLDVLFFVFHMGWKKTHTHTGKMSVSRVEHDLKRNVQII